MTTLSRKITASTMQRRSLSGQSTQATPSTSSCKGCAAGTRLKRWKSSLRSAKRLSLSNRKHCAPASRLSVSSTLAVRILEVQELNVTSTAPFTSDFSHKRDRQRAMRPTLLGQPRSLGDSSRLPQVTPLGSEAGSRAVRFCSIERQRTTNSGPF